MIALLTTSCMAQWSQCEALWCKVVISLEGGDIYSTLHTVNAHSSTFITTKLQGLNVHDSHWDLPMIWDLVVKMRATILPYFRHIFKKWQHNLQQTLDSNLILPSIKEWLTNSYIRHSFKDETPCFINGRPHWLDPQSAPHNLTYIRIYTWELSTQWHCGNNSSIFCALWPRLGKFPKTSIQNIDSFIPH